MSGLPQLPPGVAVPRLPAGGVPAPPALAPRASAGRPSSGPPGPERRLVRFEEFIRALQVLEPPPAYRLSRDSGIEYRNVRNALARPGAARLQTWERLLRSLGVELLAVLPASGARLWPVPAIRPLAPGTLSLLRASQGLGRRRTAQRAGIGVDAIDDLEQGRGLARSLERACAACGWELAVALAPGQATVEQMWADRAAQLLLSPGRSWCPRPRSPAAARR